MQRKKIIQEKESVQGYILRTSARGKYSPVLGELVGTQLARISWANPRTRRLVNDRFERHVRSIALVRHSTPSFLLSRILYFLALRLSNTL